MTVLYLTLILIFHHQKMLCWPVIYSAILPDSKIICWKCAPFAGLFWPWYNSWMHELVHMLTDWTRLSLHALVLKILNALWSWVIFVTWLLYVFFIVLKGLANNSHVMLVLVHTFLKFVPVGSCLAQLVIVHNWVTRETGEKHILWISGDQVLSFGTASA